MGVSPLLFIQIGTWRIKMADIRNGTGGLAKSGKTAVDYGVINLKYGVYHIDTAQVSGALIPYVWVAWIVEKIY
jgi:hypothetical protein